MGKQVTFHVYPGTGHGFANEEDPMGTHHPEATATAWNRLVEYLRAHL